MIEKKNFMRFTPAEIPVDIVYSKCNFMRRQPVDIGGGVKRGTRLFPGDDTPRSFFNCNLVNCEVPPGSTVVECNTSIIETQLPLRTDTITVDGVELASREFHKQRYHGRHNPVTEEYDDELVPIEMIND